MTREMNRYAESLRGLVQRHGLYEMAAGRLDAIWDLIDGEGLSEEKKQKIMKLMTEILVMIGGEK